MPCKTLLGRCETGFREAEWELHLMAEVESEALVLSTLELFGRLDQPVVEVIHYHDVPLRQSLDQ